MKVTVYNKDGILCEVDEEPASVAIAHQRLCDLQNKTIPFTRIGKAKRGRDLVEAFTGYQRARYDAALGSTPRTLLAPPSIKA